MQSYVLQSHFPPSPTLFHRFRPLWHSLPPSITFPYPPLPSITILMLPWPSQIENRTSRLYALPITHSPPKANPSLRCLPPPIRQPYPPYTVIIHPPYRLQSTSTFSPPPSYFPTPPFHFSQQQNKSSVHQCTQSDNGNWQDVTRVSQHTGKQAVHFIMKYINKVKKFVNHFCTVITVKEVHIKTVVRRIALRDNGCNRLEPSVSAYCVLLLYVLRHSYKATTTMPIKGYYV